MSDEFFLSLRHCLHHLYGVARTLSWLHFLPLALLALAIFPLTGCGDKHENKPDPARAVRYVDVGAAQLAMHSAREVMGAADVAAYSAALQAFLSPR